MVELGDAVIDTKDRYARVKRIQKLNVDRDYSEIASLFYQDFQPVMVALPFAGFMTTFAAPRMSRILSSTGETEHRFAKRAVDTSLFARASHQCGFASETGREAARRVNEMHARYDIHPDDFVLVGCDPPLFSIKMAETYGWRAVTDKEREALRLFYNRQARAYGSRKPLPPTIALMSEVVDQYMDTQLAYEPQNERLARVALKWYGDLAPPPLRPLLRAILLSVLDPRVVRACGLRAPSRPARCAAELSLKFLGRRAPRRRSRSDPMEALVRRVYPHGWDLNLLGSLPPPGCPAVSELQAAER